MVKVLPEPVTPSSTWSRSAPSTPRTSSAMAVGWSPLGSYSDTTFSRRVSGLAGCFSGMNRAGGGRTRVSDMRAPRPLQMAPSGREVERPPVGKSLHHVARLRCPAGKKRRRAGPWSDCRFSQRIKEVDTIGIDRELQAVMHRSPYPGFDGGDHCGLANRHIKKNGRAKALHHLDHNIQIELCRVGTGRDAEILGPYPVNTSLPAWGPSRDIIDGGSLSRMPSPTAHAAAPSTVRRTSKKFIAGDPRNPATNRLAGRLYKSIGSPICWTTPSRMTTTRSPSVMAST